MEGSIIFYTYGSTLELNGQQFTAGMLTADLLNLSPDEYRPMSKRMKQVTGLAEEYEQSGSIELWWKLNGELAALCGVLRRYAVFRLLLDERGRFLLCHTGDHGAVRFVSEREA